MEFSLCMIVRNEEDNIARCIESALPIVSEVVVVDTGSTDKTIEIARKYTNKVHSIQFDTIEHNGSVVEDIDLSKARNEALKHATKDWVLMLDADEYIDQRDLPKWENVKKALEKHPKAYGAQFPIYNYVNLQKTAYVKHYRICLVKNDPRIEYRGKIHEMPGDSIAEIGGYILKLEFPIRHTGYQDQQVATEKIRNRNIPILLREHERDPNHYGYTFYLGKSYLTVLGDIERAKYFFEKTLELCKDNEAVIIETMFYLGLIADREGNLVRALEIFRDVIKKDPSFPDPYYCVGHIYFRNKQYDIAIPFLEQTLKCNMAKTVVNIMAFTFEKKQVFRMLQKAYALSGYFVEAVDWKIAELKMGV